ncbi:MAG: response regulator [Anaerolineae bacterium]|nr:response regulator [Anaerolineae bacterium]
MPRLLVIEDEPHIRQFLSVNLRARGYEVIEVESAEDGLDKLQTHPPDAMLLDIKLGGMSGWSLLSVMSTHPQLRDLPVIVITASPERDDDTAPIHINIAAKIVKPVSVHKLLETVRRVVKG